MSDRKFNVGRQSEQLYNEELFKLYESIRHLLEIPENDKSGPDAKLHGALWLNLATNELNYYNKELNQWEIIFRDKFRIVDRLMDQFPPDRPVYGQLWINQDVLMFYDGSQWKPIKALMQDGSQINLATFEDFLIMSPLHPPGNLVINDGTTSNKSQFLVPNTKAGKLFINREYRNDYEEINAVTIQYPKQDLIGKTPSWVHVNPGKLTSIKKRLFKIDKESHHIPVSAYNTEFYGFKRDSAFGYFLRPGGNDDDGEYMVHPEGIYLSYNAAQNFDYVLAITYEFSWIKSSGRLTRTNTKRNASSYYVGGFGGPINVFVEGYDLENKYYYYDALTKVVNITDPNMNENLEVSFFRSIMREYGLIRERTLDGKGIIKLRYKYKNPLVFVNGQALHSSLGDVEINDDKILVAGARRDMSYCVMELEGSYQKDGGEHEAYNMFLESGRVSQVINNQGIIYISNFKEKVPEDEGLVLFVDGLLCKKEDVIRNYEEGYITVNGLQKGQEYILLHDKFHNLLYDENKLQAALVTGKTDESLVFMNNLLICNDTAIVTSKTMEEEAEVAAHGELKLFLDPTDDGMQGEFKIWSEYDKAWVDCDEATIDAVKKIAFSYENGLHNISLNIDYDVNDYFEVYAYNFANTIEKPLIINSFYVEDEAEIEIDSHFVHGSNSLQVFLDGVRQYPSVIRERADGSGFAFVDPETDELVPVTGKITYIIEHPEGGANQTCTRQELDHRHVLNGTSNVYRTDISLYPGRVTVYVSGLRQPKESYVILDNHTIMFKDKETQLIGAENNFPVKHIRKDDGSVVEVEHKVEDRILIEVRQEFQRQERTITITDPNTFDINVEEHDLPKEILEAADEILIFFNGVFSGLRNNLGYVKDRNKGVITILDGSYVEMMNHDPLYKFFMLNTEKHLEWQDKNGGKPYEPNINNKITLEWR